MAPFRSAFTLFEMVLVLAIITVAIALAYPTLEDMYGAQKMLAATDMVRAHWAMARSRAIEEGRPYRFSRVQGMGNFRIAPDSADYWAGGAPSAPADPDNPPLDLSRALPSGVRFTTTDALMGGGLDQSGESSLPPEAVDPAMWTTAVVFLPDGTARGAAQEDVTIALHLRGTQPYALTMRALTGVVTARPFYADAQRP